MESEAPVLDSLELGIIVLDQEALVRGWNEWMTRMSGITSSQAVGRSLANLFPDLGKSRLTRAYHNVLETGLPEFLSQALHRSPLPLFGDRESAAIGKRLSQAITLRPVRLEKGRGCVIQIQDVSAAVEREATLRTMTRQAEAAKEAQKDFLAKMSHELRTPMNGILALTELILERSDDPEQRSLLRTVHSSGLSLLAILNDLLDFSKIEAGMMAIEDIPVDVHQLVVDTHAILKTKAESGGIQFRLEWGPGVPRLMRTDPLRVRQILLNLVGNAIKFTREGSVALTVSLHRKLGDGYLEVAFQVADTGIGIEHPEGLFRDFVQADSGTSRRYGGTGLGLSISKKLAELLGGRIAVESTLNVGSEFTLYLPMIAAEPLGTPRQEVQTKPLSGIRALAVDDNPTNLLVLEKLLERLGVTSKRATDGAAGVALVQAENFDVVLMDCHMPVMDGLEATRQIRKTHPGIPIVAVTASALEEDRLACIDAGMDAFLTKPVSLASLSAALRQVLEDKSQAVPPTLNAATN